MGVKVLKREYKNQFYGKDKNVDWLLGNVGDWQRLEITFEAVVDFIGSNRDTLNIDEVRNAFVLNNGKKWNEYGFDIGDEVVLTYTISIDTTNNGDFVDTSFSRFFVIQNIYNDTMEVDGDLEFNTVNIIPTDRGNFKISDVRLTSVKEPQGLKLRYSHLTNDNYDTNNIRSIIDGTFTEFSFAGLDELVPNIKKEMNPDGLQSGMAIDKAFIERIGNESVDKVIYSLQGAQAMLLETLRQLIIKIDLAAFSIPLNPNTSSIQEVKQSKQVYIPFNPYPTSISDFFIDGNLDSIFYFNASQSGIKYFDVNLKFKTIYANDNSNKDKIQLSIFKYKNGSDLEFSQKIDIKEWQNARDYVNKSTSFNGVIAVNTNQGESLALCLAYYHPGEPTKRGVYLLPEIAEVELINTDSGTNKYKASIDFMMLTLFDTPQDLENGKLPNSLLNEGSLADNFELEVFPEWNNPNTSIKNNPDHTERLGNTGWFNENFNGLDNNFKVERLRYTDENGNVLQQLDYNTPVIVEALVSGVKNLSADTELGFGFSWVPKDDKSYKELNTPYHDNLFVNTGRKYIDGVNDSFNLAENTGSTVFEGNSNTNARMDVQGVNNFLFTPAGADLVLFKAKFIPTPEFSQLFESKEEDDRNYILWLSVADRDLRINFSDRVSLLLDYNNMVKFIPPAGPYQGMTAKFIEHPQNENVEGVDKYFGFVEDDVLARVLFTYDTTKDVVFRSMIFGYEVENKETGATYELESYPINLTEFAKDTDGVPQFDFEDIRGFKMNDGNNKNWVKLKRRSDVDNGTVKGFIGYFATKIRWEDWISRDGVPNEFFDVNKENNGYNNDWIDYLRSGGKNGYKINFFVYTQLIENGEFKNHKNTWEITFADYDENPNIETTHEYFRDSDNTLLNIGTDTKTGKPLGVILNNEPTRIEITYTNLVEDFDINKLYAVTTIEIENGAGEFEHRQLSSVWPSENDNILVPLQGETKLKIEQLSPRVIKTSCLIDNNRLTDALRYKVSGRLGCFSEGNGNANSGGLYEERYEENYE